MRFGSDLVIEFLTRAGIEAVSLNPGASFRGLQDSLVHAGPEAPEPIVVLHEEIAVAIAHGYAKAAGRPMAVFVHDLVGLQHASMAIFNAFVDNVPMLVIGGSGPRDAAKRRPWIDWVHAGHPQGALVRDFVKWDDEPASVDAIPDSLARALRISTTAPMGPVYVSIDAGLQEEPIGDSPVEIRTMSQPVPMVAPPAVVERIAQAIAGAQRPAILVDRPGPGAFDPLVRVAEKLPAAVVDLGARMNFPTNHWANLSGAQRKVLSEADFILALEIRDLAWPLTDLDLATRETTWIPQETTPIVSVGLTETQHNGFLHRESLVTSVDYVTSDVGAFLTELDGHLAERGSEEPWEQSRARLEAEHRRTREEARESASTATGGELIAPAHLAWCLGEAISDGPWQLANGLLGNWPRKLWDFTHERHYIGRSGGEGLGYGLPASLGAALVAARQEDGPLVVDIQPDGDMLYTAQALWTAAHHRLPLLIVVHNNRTYGKDELHQTEMALSRERGSLDRVGVGIHIDRPAIDFVGLARSYGVEGHGPVSSADELPGVLAQAVRQVREERVPVLVDVLCNRPTKSSY